MSRLCRLWRLSVVKKIVMAVTGLALCLFVLGHMLGNLKIYLGRDAFDDYAGFLRVMGHPLLPPMVGLDLARLGLIVCLLLHLTAAWQLYRMSAAARQVAYRHYSRDLVFSQTSLMMRLGGVTLLAFIAFHLAHLTWGWIYPSQYLEGDPYHNVVAGFQHWWLSLLYILAMVPLCLHLYHGLWSAAQTLGCSGPRLDAWRRPVAAAFALIIFVGNVSIPLAVLCGIVKPW
jgi:succinate dehydrogenase / fumarate reductase cytochrome b subunit